MSLRFKKIIVRLRMWYAKFRGHKGHRWDYEPSEWYMGRHKKNNLEKHFLTRKHRRKVFGHSKSSNGHCDQNIQNCPKICEHLDMLY